MKYLLLISITFIFLNSTFAQNDNFFKYKNQSLEAVFWNRFNNVQLNGVAYCVIRIVNTSVTYSYYGNPNLLTQEFKDFMEKIKSGWNKKTIGKQKLLLPIYFGLNVENARGTVTIEDLLKYGPPNGNYFILSRIGVVTIKRESE